MSKPLTGDRLYEFLYNLNEMYRLHYVVKGYTFALPPTFTAAAGRNYIKIVEVNPNNHTEAYCFIDKNTGDILKAASWKAPAKGVRGSIWNPACDVGTDKPCNVYGGNLYAS